MQLELFPLKETDKLKLEIESLRAEVATLRRGLFARFGELHTAHCRLEEEFRQSAYQQLKLEKEAFALTSSAM